MRLGRAIGNPFVLALLCLPTLLAVGLMTSAPLGPQALQVSLAGAFVAFTIGSLVVAVLARAPGEIAGPTASTTVIYAALGMDLANRAAAGQGLWEIWAGMSMAVMMMGALLLVAGLLRLGDFIKFLPAPVTAGFVTGIGLLIIWSQLGPILGLTGKMPPLQNLAGGMDSPGYSPVRALIVGSPCAGCVIGSFQALSAQAPPSRHASAGPMRTG